MTGELRHVLAANVKRRRAEMGLSQAALAERIGIDVARISDIEREVRDVKLNMVDRLATALKVDPGQLLEP